jgi:hypothetical protein
MEISGEKYYYSGNMKKMDSKNKKLFEKKGIGKVVSLSRMGKHDPKEPQKNEDRLDQDKKEEIHINPTNKGEAERHFPEQEDQDYSDIEAGNRTSRLK